MISRIQVQGSMTRRHEQTHKTEHLDKNYLQRSNNRSSKIEHFSAFTSQGWPVLHDWKSYAWDTHHTLMLPRLSFSAVSHNQGAKNQVNQYERDHWGCDSLSTGKEEQKADQCLKNYLKAMAMTRTIWLINKKIETTKNKPNFEYIFNQLIKHSDLEMNNCGFHRSCVVSKVVEFSSVFNRLHSCQDKLHVKCKNSTQNWWITFAKSHRKNFAAEMFCVGISCLLLPPLGWCLFENIH
jgi:hypothetical protein